MVRNSSGFEYAPERPSANAFKDQKWGWRSETPGKAQPPPAATAAVHVLQRRLPAAPLNRTVLASAFLVAGSWVELEFDTQAADQSSEADTRVWCVCSCQPGRLVLA